MHGYNVFLPIGFDAFGLPAENAAIKGGFHPLELDDGQHRDDAPPVPHHGRHLRLGQRGRHLRPRLLPLEPVAVHFSPWSGASRIAPVSPVDWCPNDGTLAREQVEGTDRRCWRCGAQVEKRELAQWYLRTTAYADELLDFAGLDWPEPVRIMQTNWIGRSSGAEIVFETAPAPHHAGGEELRVFTTRPDTLFGATFMVLAPEHPLVATLTAPDRRAEVEAYVAAAARRRRSTACPRTGRRPASPSARTRSTPSTASGSRSSSRTTCWRLRHGRDHGRPRARRARLRLRPEVRPADRQGRDAQGRRPAAELMADAFIAHASD